MRETGVVGDDSWLEVEPRIICVPGEPGLARDEGAPREWAELVRAWWRDAGLPAGLAVRAVVLHTSTRPPNMRRVAALVAEAIEGEVVSVEARRSRHRDGLVLEVVGRAALPTLPSVRVQGVDSRVR
jgi:hypothetical protein